MRYSILALALFSTPLLAGIAGSKHDLSTDTNSGTNEICVYCHTPHGSNNEVAAPLWNKTLPTTDYELARYNDMGTATLDGTEAPVGSVSLACLSCHDGTQARDMVVNAPGAGLNSGQMGSVTALAGTPVPVLWDDDTTGLKNDHPISIQYAGGACFDATTDCDPSGKPTGDPDFKVAQASNINGNNYFWVDTSVGTADSRDKTDMILYNGVTTGPSVECGSCHDPHNDTTGSANQVAFLRISNANSELCLACHTK